jgi:hypothetical protein
VTSSPRAPQQLALIPLFDSRIISGFPEIFAEFRVNHFQILSRRNSDGFKLQEFHHRCDDHANTLTVILDTKESIFVIFPPSFIMTSIGSTFSSNSQKMTGFHSGHFHALYELIYGPCPYLSTQSFPDLLSTLKSDSTTLISISKLLRSYVPPASQRIKSLLTTPFLIRLRSYHARAQLERALVPEFQSYLQSVFNSLSLLSDISTFSGISKSYSHFFESCTEIQSNFETAMNVKLEIIPPKHSDLTSLLPQAIEKVLQSRSTELKVVDDRLIDLRFQNHTCTVCRFRPAIYFAEPCMHPCICQGCMRNLSELGSAMTHCYTCQNRITKVRPFSYLIV